MVKVLGLWTTVHEFKSAWDLILASWYLLNLIFEYYNFLTKLLIFRMHHAIYHKK